MIDFARAGLTALLAAFALPGAAQACTDSHNVRYYFQRQPPQMTPDIMFVQVMIVRKTMSSVEARLTGRFSKLSANGMIHIELPQPPYGENCVDWGDLDGPVYVVARSSLVQNGHASIIAEPVGKSDRGAGGTPIAASAELRRLRKEANIWIDPTYAGLSKP